MDGRTSVVFTTLVAFIVFILAGDEATRKTTNGIASLSGKPTKAASSNESGPKLTVQRAVGWGGMFLFLIILSDIPATSELAAAFAWLILLSVLITFGPDAFGNIETVLKAE